MAPDEWEYRWPSKFDSIHYNPTVKEFINDNCLVDIWRQLNPGGKQYSWYKPDGSCKSRFDYWLAADTLGRSVSDALMSRDSLTDHCIIEITLNKTYKLRKN